MRETWRISNTQNKCLQICATKCSDHTYLTCCMANLLPRAIYVESRITKINLPSMSATSFKHLCNNVLVTYLKPHCTTLDRVTTDTHIVMSEKCTNIHCANEAQHIQHKADNKVQLISHQHHSWHPVCWPMEW